MIKALWTLIRYPFSLNVLYMALFALKSNEIDYQAHVETFLQLYFTICKYRSRQSKKKLKMSRFFIFLNEINSCR